MRWPEQTPDEAWLDDRLEAYLDGELPEDEARYVERLLADDEGGSEALLLAHRIRDTLRAAPQPSCPPIVARRVMAEVRPAAVREARRRVSGWLTHGWNDFWQPALAMTCLLLVVLSTTLVGRLPERTAPPPDEVAVALADVKWALAYLSEVGRETGRSVRRDVLEEHVVLPMQNAVGAALPEQDNQR